MRDPVASTDYFMAAAHLSSLDSTSCIPARIAFLIGVPFMLLLTALSGWVLTGRSLTPAVLMAERARTIGADNMTERLQVSRARDELGRLASALNELLDRLAAASLSQRQFMADAAHELRTPLSVVQTATTVTLMNANSTVDDYRSTLLVIDGYIKRLSRSVNDVFRLARADAGFKSLHIESLYLDELVTDAVKAARVLAIPKENSWIASTSRLPPVTFPGPPFE
ncbi:MAG: HAMP domain-containing protein [Acidobacteriota bacterium]|nr:HAMP domain-containing protein [Acidobacteriota bacterium]